MGAHAAEVRDLLSTGGGVIARRKHPHLTSSLDWLLRHNELVPVMPGIYAPRDLAPEPQVRLQAAMHWDPDIIFTGATAARLSFWPDLKAPIIHAAVPGDRRSPPGFAISRRTVPPELVIERNGLRITCPALTALDLCDDQGGDATDTVLRSRQASLPGLYEALAVSGQRWGNVQRRTLLLDSRAEPWSAAEREGHKLFRAEGITGWKANLPVEIHGVCFYLDVAFRAVRLAVEIDGREHHIGRAVFESDRWRQNELVLAGWRVLRFTWDMIVNHPHLVLEQLERALADRP